MRARPPFPCHAAASTFPCPLTPAAAQTYPAFPAAAQTYLAFPAVAQTYPAFPAAVQTLAAHPFAARTRIPKHKIQLCHQATFTRINGKRSG
jgi:hypothetical protein